MFPTKRQILLVALAIGLLAGIAPSSGKIVGKRDLSWTARRSCGVVCPWTYAQVGGAAGINSGNSNKEACAQVPISMPESWDDLTEVVPAKIGAYRPTKLIVELTPTVDWELYVCAVSKSGKVSFKARAASISSTCTVPDAAGCTKSASVNVKPGQQFLLRAYNVVDPFATVRGTLRYDGTRV